MLMLQPRRPAARMIAARMASLLGEPVGQRVGYQIRFERRIGPDTRIEVLTEGILTRRLQTDPTLAGVGLLVFDEFHERSLQVDLGLALALDVIAGLRPDLRLLLMSATLDADLLIARLPSARLIRATGRPFPVAIHHAERSLGGDLVRPMVTAIQTALARHPGDLLAFLPGTGEIERCREALLGQVASQIQILPLHGRLSSEQQQRVLAPNDQGGRRVLLATDLAETSLTIPGIQVVIDSGLARKPRFDPAAGLTRLVTQPIARSSAEQRAGRAGRLGPGVCYRLWTAIEDQGRPQRHTPEILIADLAALALELHLWGVTTPDALQWIDPPPPAAWQQAVDLLRRLGALDSRGAITPLGRQMARLPLHPRLAVLLLSAQPAARGLAADLAALLSERDPLLDRPGVPRSADLGLRLDALQTWRAREGARDAGDRSASARAHDGWGLDPRRLATVDRSARQLHRLTVSAPAGPASTAGELIALTYPERIAQRRDQADGRYRLANGSGARLYRDDPLGVAPYLAIANLEAAGADHQIRLALPMSESDIHTVMDARIRVRRVLAWDPRREAVAARLVRELDAIELSAQPVPLEDTDAVTDVLLNAIRMRLEQVLPWTQAARQLRARIALLRRVEPQAGWPDLSPAALQAQATEWLAADLTGCASVAALQRLDLTRILAARLDWRARERLEQEAPTQIKTPAGTWRRIDYQTNDDPILAVPLQELFGLVTTPRVCRGRVPLVLHLLSPARRPIQVTRDLAGFWERHYAEVRKELRGRYPKHAWPEDPSGAQPVAGVQRKPPTGATR